MSLVPAVQFVHQSTHHGWPANVVMVLQSRSDPVTGALFYGAQNETPAFSTLLLILDAFVGCDMKGVMGDTSVKAAKVMRLGGVLVLGMHFIPQGVVVPCSA